jgi:hypothetical protein
MAFIQDLKYVVSALPAEAFTSGLLSGGSAVLFGSPSLFGPAVLTGAGVAVVHRVLDIVGVKDKVWHSIRDADVDVDRRELPTICKTRFHARVAVTLVTFIVSALTVAPVVGMLGTAYKVHWVGSFVLTVLVDLSSRRDTFALDYPLSSPAYFMVPASFGAVATAWALQAVTQIRSLARS